METRKMDSQWTNEGNKLVGFASVYDSPTQISERGKKFTEVVRRGAFKKALESNADVIATFNHDPNQLLGRTSAKTLKLIDTHEGLRFEVDLPDTMHGNMVRELTKRGDLNGASFTFQVNKGGEKWQGDTRELTNLALYEVGVVVTPAYKDAKVQLRSVEFAKIKLDFYEKYVCGE